MIPRHEIALLVKFPIIGALRLYSNRAGESWPSLSTLSQESGLSRSAVVRQLAGLEKAGILRRDRPPRGRTTTHYRFIATSATTDTSAASEPSTSAASEPRTSAASDTQSDHLTNHLEQTIDRGEVFSKEDAIVVVSRALDGIAFHGANRKARLIVEEVGADAASLFATNLQRAHADPKIKSPIPYALRCTKAGDEIPDAARSDKYAELNSSDRLPTLSELDAREGVTGDTVRPPDVWKILSDRAKESPITKRLREAMQRDNAPPHNLGTVAQAHVEATA